jgi:branched-chain amino acid transport system substrate-binding protein
MFRALPLGIRLPSVCVAVTSLALMAAACGSSESQSDDGGDGPIVVYSAIGQSGAFAASTKAIVAGMKAAVEEINANGGLLDRKVELELENSQSDPTKAVSLVTERVTSDDPPEMVFTGGSDTEIVPVLPVLNRNGIFAMSPGIAEEERDAEANPLQFTVGAAPEVYADFLAEYLSSQGYQRIALLGADRSDAETFLAAHGAEFEKQGLDVVAHEKFAPEAVDMSAQLERIKGQNPDVILISGVGFTQYVLQSRLKVGMTNVPMVGDGTASIFDISSAVPEEAMENYVHVTFTSNLQGKGGEGKEGLLAQLNKANVESSLPVAIYGMAWDAVMAWANGVESAQSLDAEKVAEQLEKGENLEQQLPFVNFPSYAWSSETHISTQSGDGFSLVPVLPVEDGEFVGQ